jgi:hypothetical protein
MQTPVGVRKRVLGLRYDLNASESITHSPSPSQHGQRRKREQLVGPA